MTVLENALAHFASGRETLKQVSVPEWGQDGTPAQIYFRPVMSLAEKGEILKAYQGDNPAEALATVLILRARDADGKALFNKHQTTQIMRSVDEDVVSRVVNQMSEQSDDLSLEDAEKN